MRKILLLLTILLVGSIALTACNNDDNNEKKEKKDENVEAPIDEGNSKDEATDNSSTDDSSTDEDDSDLDDSKGSKEGDFSLETEDQLDLGLGDTGKFETSIGTFELTLDAVKFTDELDGETSTRDKLVILDITVDNISNETLVVEDLLSSLELTHDLEGSGTSNSAEYFDSIEELKGDLAAGEKVSGQLIFDAVESAEYHLRERSGNVSSGTTNQVIWTFTEKEAK